MVSTEQAIYAADSIHPTIGCTVSAGRSRDRRALFFVALAFLFGCSEPTVRQVTVVRDVPYSTQVVLERGDWCGFRLPNGKELFLSCIKDDKPQLVPNSAIGSRTYYGDHPWAEDQSDYIKVGESKVQGRARREYTLFIEQFCVKVVEGHAHKGSFALPVDIQITKLGEAGASAAP